MSVRRWLTSAWAQLEKSSLLRRFLIVTAAGQIAFGLALGASTGLFLLRQEAAQRKTLLEQTASALAASIMPMVADQENERVQAQVDSVMEAMGAEQIECVAVLDGAGEVLAESCSGTRDCSAVLSVQPRDNPWSVLTKPQVLERPIAVQDIEIARLRVQFKPMGMANALVVPVLGSLAVVLTISLVSLPWTAWLFVSSIGEPLEDLRDGALKLAAGDLDARLWTGKNDEVGLVQKALDHMAEEVQRRQQEIERSYAEMEQAYRTEAKAKECLAKLMEMKSSFVAVASHELKTPVAVIRLYAEMLREGVLRPSEPGYAEALNAMIAASGRLDSIISDLMDASLWERGEIAIKRETVDISELVAEAVHDAEALCSGHQTRVVLQEPVPEIVGEVDPLRLRQVLDNMISNAVKYSDGAPEALVSLRQERHKAIIEVTDFGRGIPEGASGTVFGLFGRVAGESDAVSGLGLGMAISQRIALAHGGTLSFRANPAGKGTVFSLALPLGLGATERPSSHERARVV